MNLKTSYIILLNVLFSFIFSVSIVAQQSFTAENIYGRLTTLQCDSMVKANETNPNFVILDVRTESEWLSDHLYGSIFRSTGDPNFDSLLDELPKHKTFLLHCRSGSRSAAAFTKMKEKGFAEVYEMIGGILAWEDKGLPTTKLIEPKLMLVSYSDILKGENADTINVTVTNRANGNLIFNDAVFSDIHLLENDFHFETVLDGAQDYTFSIVHSPFYDADDSTKISINSNGGSLDFNIIFKNGSITTVDDRGLADISLYPNPGSERIFINSSQLNMFDEISVYSITGQKLKSYFHVSAKQSIDVSDLNNGIYFLRIKAGNQYSSQQFLIKH
jgi:rhodanese-related sulfurtransferase